MRKQTASAAKAVVSLYAAVALVAVFLPSVLSIHERDWADQGSRTLIIFATEGGREDFRFNARAVVEADGDYRLRFFVDVPAPDPGTEKARTWVDYEIVVAGSDVEGKVRCVGDEQTLTKRAISALSPGPKHLLEVDWTSGPESATNFQSEGSANPAEVGTSAQPEPTPTRPSVAVETPTAQPEAVHHQGRLATWFAEEDPPRQYSPDGSGYGVWVQECVLDRSLVWATTLEDEPTQGPQATLFIPQVNYTAIDGRTEFQSLFDSRIHIVRADGLRLVDGFPSPTATDDSWFLRHVAEWEGAKGEQWNFLWTDQPTLLFANADDADAHFAVYLMALKLLIALVIKINDDFWLRSAEDTKRDSQG